MAGVATGGGGISGSGGAAGPARSGLTSTFQIGGNTGIGTSQGLSLNTIAILAVVVVIGIIAFAVIKK